MKARDLKNIRMIKYESDRMQGFRNPWILQYLLPCQIIWRVVEVYVIHVTTPPLSPCYPATILGEPLSGSRKINQKLPIPPGSLSSYQEVGETGKRVDCAGMETFFKTRPPQY